jgi:arginase
MVRYAVIEAPSVLGLYPGGVERLPAALIEAGLADVLGARRAGRVVPPPYEPTRDVTTGLLNPTGLRDYAHQLARTTGAVLITASRRIRARSSSSLGSATNRA